MMIALEKFEYTQKNLRFWVISSYHLSQFLIASSVLYIANGGFISEFDCLNIKTSLHSSDQSRVGTFDYALSKV